MSNQSKKERRESKQRKEEQKLQEEEKKRNLMYATMAAIILISAIIAMAYFGLGGTQQPANNPINVQGVDENSYIEIPMADVSDTARKYSYTYQGTTITYFVAIGPDGEVHTALDACDACFAEKKGYVQEGDVMKCNNCGLTFNMVDIGTTNVGGGCWPHMLPHSIEDGKLIIQKTDIEAGKSYFP